MKTHHDLTKDTRTKKYYARIQIRGVLKRFVFGKRKRQSDEQLKELEKNILAGKYPFTHQQTSLVIKEDGSRDMRIEELAVKHLEWAKANRAGGTFELRRHYVRRFLDFIGACNVSDITTQRIEEFQAWAKIHSGKSPNAGNEALRNVKVMFNWAIENEICTINIKKYPRLSYEPARTKRFTDEEMRKLLEKSEGEFKDTILFALLTGLRPQELRALQKQNLVQKDESHFLIIERHKSSRTAKRPIPRSIPLVPEAVAILQRQISRHSHDSYLFLNADGKQYSAGAYRNRFLRLCRRSGVTPLPPYALRHYYATAQVLARTNQTTLSQLMGHSTLQMTSRYVANNTDAHVQANQDLASKIMSLIQAPGQSNTKESAVPGCKIETKPVAKPVADHGAGRNARKGNIADSNTNACNYAI